MNSEEFREDGKKLIDYVCEFRESIPEFRVVPGSEVKANDLKNYITDKIPIDGEKFVDIMQDFKEHIVPRLCHLTHPKFGAYFPMGCTYSSLIGELLSMSVNQVPIAWRAAPGATEHEQLTLNMFGKALDLPKFFLYDEKNKDTGGGVMQGSGSDCIFLALLAARHRAVKLVKGNIKASENVHDSLYLPGMVAYTSMEAHSAVQKAAKVAMVRLRILPTDERGSLRGDTLAKAIEEDIQFGGFTPIFVSGTVGTTGICAFDNLEELGNVCRKYPTIWFHVDGAYAGNSFILPEMRRFKRGLELADSFNTNPNKLLLTAFECACFWVKNIQHLKEAMTVNPTYLKRDDDEGEDLRHFGVPLSRRFRSVKLWCVLRTYGLRGLTAYIRNHIAMAKHFEALMWADNRFKIVNEVHLGLVCFKLLVPGATSMVEDRVNIELLQEMNKSGEIYLVPATFHGGIVIRYCVVDDQSTYAITEENFRTVQKFATKALRDYDNQQLEFQMKGKAEFHPRFSYTRSVPHSEHVKLGHPDNLHDAGGEICMCEECEKEANIV